MYKHAMITFVMKDLDVYEEEVSTTYTLLNSVVSIDKYRHVFELGHIMNQLKSGCVQCKLPLNMCST